MKKVTRIFGAICMVGLFALVSTSCKKKTENGEMTITVTVPGIETVGDRAYIDQYGHFWWHEQDFVRVYNLAAEADAIDSKTSIFTKIGATSTQTARFRGPSVGAKLAEGYRVFYPVGMVTGTDGLDVEEVLWNENRQVFVVSDHQQFHNYEAEGHHQSMIDPAAMPMAMQVNKLTDPANLHHMFGVASFSLNAANGTTVVVDSVVLHDNTFNLTGKVSVKLHKVAVDNSQGIEHNLDSVWAAYKGLTPAYIQNTLAPELEWLGWEPDYTTLGQDITLDCRYEQDGEIKGVTLGEYPYGTFFNFMLRPLALSGGFTLTVYVHDGEPVELTDSIFEFGNTTCDYNWAVKPGKRKTYTKSFPIN